jgi:hypothetical protein
MLEIEENKSEIEILKKKRDKHLSDAAALDAAIKVLEGNSDKPIDWKNSALSCLRKHNFPLRTVDVLNCMFVNDPEKLDDSNKRRNYVNALSIALNNLSDRGFLGRISVQGYKGYFYGFKQLFYDEKTLQPKIQADFMYQLLENEESVFNVFEKGDRDSAIFLDL